MKKGPWFLLRAWAVGLDNIICIFGPIKQPYCCTSLFLWIFKTKSNKNYNDYMKLYKKTIICGQL